MSKSNVIEVPRTDRKSKSPVFVAVDISSAHKVKGGIFLNIIHAKNGDTNGNGETTIRMCNLQLDGSQRKLITKTADKATKTPRNGSKATNKQPHRAHVH